MQTKAELEAFYSSDDPWDYDASPDDAARVARVLAAIPKREYERTLDIGCGNGFLTVRLPGEHVIGVDLSERAVAAAARRAERVGSAARFEALSLFELPDAELGTFDLVVTSGVFYPQYIGRATAVVTEILRCVVRPGGVLISAHIDDWCRYRPPFTSLAISVDPYREFVHRLEVFQR